MPSRAAAAGLVSLVRPIPKGSSDQERIWTPSWSARGSLGRSPGTSSTMSTNRKRPAGQTVACTRMTACPRGSGVRSKGGRQPNGQRAGHRERRGWGNPRAIRGGLKAWSRHCRVSETRLSPFVLLVPVPSIFLDPETCKTRVSSPLLLTNRRVLLLSPSFPFKVATSGFT